MYHQNSTPPINSLIIHFSNKTYYVKAKNFTRYFAILTYWIFLLEYRETTLNALDKFIFIKYQNSQTYFNR